MLISLLGIACLAALVGAMAIGFVRTRRVHVPDHVPPEWTREWEMSRRRAAADPDRG